MDNPFPNTTKVLQLLSMELDQIEKQLRHDIDIAEELLRPADSSDQGGSEGNEVKSTTATPLSKGGSSENLRKKPFKVKTRTKTFVYNDIDDLLDKAIPGHALNALTLAENGKDGPSQSDCLNNIQKTLRSGIDFSLQDGHQIIDNYLNLRKRHKNKRGAEEDLFLKAMEESFQDEISMMPGFDESQDAVLSQFFPVKDLPTPVEIVPEWAEDDKKALESRTAEFSEDIQCEVNRALVKDLENINETTEFLPTIFKTVSYVKDLNRVMPNAVAIYNLNSEEYK